MILLEEEADKIIELFHRNLGHLGINRLIFEIEMRGIFINNIANKTKDIVKNCEICIATKLNKYVKPNNIQIISHKPLERVQIDLTYFINKIAIDELRDKYLLNFTDHFSKYSKGFLIDNKYKETIILINFQNI